MVNRLKALELQGYKTFASKTKFQFPGRVTAIVGPNGSGKSNIADAIRWVLGEQAFSMLRGKKTIDMIFSGSEQRSRSSMASVSIAFDNQSGWLPIDFSEVVITRRAYRNGENEYLINNQRVRLREINELLANSGLGERTYTIIGQGLVDTALSLKPEERRRFFEEAAGIGLYRGRREESIQKLDKTTRNMDRVKDILGELKPRLESLSKQSEKVKEYNLIRNDLDVLLKDWYGYYWHKTIDDLKYAEQFFRQQEEKLISARDAKDQLEVKLKRVQESLNSKRQELGNYHSQLSALHAEQEMFTRNVAVLEERKKSIKEKNIDAREQITSLTDERNSILRDIEGIKEKTRDSLEEQSQVEQELNESRSLLQNKLTEKLTVEANLNQLQKETHYLENEIFQSENKKEELKHRQNILENEIQIVVDNIAVIKIEIQSAQEQHNLFSKQMEEAVTEKLDIEKQISELKKQKESISQSVENTRLRQDELQAELYRITAELDLLVEAEENLIGFTSGSAAIFKKIREGGISGHYDLLIDQIEVSQKYEIAIAASLGEALEGIIISKKTDPEIALDYLAKSQNPRSILLNTQWSKKPELQIKENGKFVFASSVIQTSQEYKELINNLLYCTLLVNDRKQAIKILPELPRGYKVVTLSGEVFDTQGTAAAGKDIKVKAISRKRERSQLEIRRVNTEKEIDDVRKELEELNGKSASLLKKIDSLKVMSETSIRTMNELSIAQQKQEIIKTQKEQIADQEEKRLEGMKKTVLEIQQNNQLLDEKKKSGQEELEKKKATITRLMKDVDAFPIEEIRTKVVSLSSNKAVADQVANQFSELLKAKGVSLEKNDERIDDLKRRLDILEEDLVALEKEYEEQKSGNTLAFDKIQELSGLVTPLENEVEHIISQQGSLLDEVDEGRRVYSIAERHATQSQMKIAKIRDSLEDLRKHIEEDFGLILDSNSADGVSPTPFPFEGLVANLPKMENLPEDLEDRIKQKKSFVRRLGPVNPDAEKEFLEVTERYQFLTDQLHDLEKAEKDLREIITELDAIMKRELEKTFTAVQAEFKEIFSQLFDGGSARLFIEDENNIMESGIEIEATLPGRRKQELALLSGGERSLTAVALIFALLKISPTPFCILDEVDAMLDESNVVRFGDLLRELSDSTQFIVITHNRNTVQLAEILYGVTMGKDSASQVISLKLDELTEEYIQ